jgi:hypothetical protein
MSRSAWNRFMIVLMVALIVFGLREIFRSPEPLNESRYLLSVGIAVIVIIMKIGEMRRAESEQQKPSQV